MVLHFCVTFGRKRNAFESRRFMAGGKMDLRQSRKIKNLLTHKAPNLPRRKVEAKLTTSLKPMK